MPFERNWDLHRDSTNSIVDMYTEVARPKDGWALELSHSFVWFAGVGFTSAFLIATGSSCAG
jgi:hypothetical protein